MTPGFLTVGEVPAAAQLKKMKRRATGLLALVTIAFVLVAALTSPSTWTDYALAGLEGSMVGGLADWFAVTALFRHPLGIPIPHTAVIRERKDQFGETLGAFVQENFLSPEIVAERLGAARVAERTAAWLVNPRSSRAVARAGVEALVAAVEIVGDDDVHRLLHDEIDRAVRSVPFAPLAGRALRVAVEEQRHRPVVDAVLRGAVRFLEEQEEPLRKRFAEASPWWLPGALEDRFFERLLDGAQKLIASVAEDPDHELRATLDERLWALADRLEHDPAMATTVQGMVRDALDHPDVRGWTRHLWADLKGVLEAQRSDPDSALQARLAEAVVAIGERLGEDPVLQQRLTGAVESAARYLTEHHRDEIASLISATVARWDPEETSSKLELLLGRDLQFIRINGTVVGGLAGLAIHGLADALR